MTGEQGDRGAGSVIEVQDPDGTLWKQVRAIEAGAATRRRKFLAYEVICGRCGEPLMSVLRTSPQWSLLVSSAPPRTRVVMVPAVGLSSGPSQRRGERVLLALQDDAIDDYREFLATCHCQQVRWPLCFLASALRRGDRRKVLRPGTLS